MNNKICMLVDSLSQGGAEKVATNLSTSLTSRGYEVTIVSMKNEINYSFEGTLFNFGIVKQNHNRISSLFIFKNFFNKNKFAIIIDHRKRSNFFKELLFSKYIFRKCRVIYAIHSYDLKYYSSFLRWPKLAVLPHVHQATFVSVCDAIQLHLMEELKLKSTRIFNYVLPKQIFAMASVVEETRAAEYIIGVGRLTVSKQFDVLIRAYANSDLRSKSIKLLILGDGPEKKKLEELITDLNLNVDVELIPFNRNPYNLMKNAKCFVLASKSEGFPMVLLEALTLNVPVIAFDCNSGPREIICNGINGILIENNTADELTNALNTLVLDIAFYEQIKMDIKDSISGFSEEKIAQEWINLLENLR